MNLHIPAPRRFAEDTTHDRISVMRDAHRTLIALADGMDASHASQLAAALAVDELATCFRVGALPNDPLDWEMVLQGLDHIVLRDRAAGESSVLVMLVENGVVVGASVGNSLAYIATAEGDVCPLNARSRTATRLGSGMAVPTGFGPIALQGRLITRRTEPVDARRTRRATAAA